MGLHEIRISAVKAWESEHISFPGDSSVCEVREPRDQGLAETHVTSQRMTELGRAPSKDPTFLLC